MFKHSFLRSALSVHGASPLRDEFIEGFDINGAEVKDLVAFLNSLTDEDFLHNPAFSDPNPPAKQSTKQHAH